MVWTLPLISAGLSGLTSLMGGGMTRGANMQKYMDMMNGNMGRAVPALANQYYNAMMASPMGSAMQMNAMQGARAGLQGFRQGAGTGMFQSGLGAAGQGLANSMYFNNLNQNQSALYNQAFQSAQQSAMQNMGLAAGMYGNDLQRGYGVMGAGFNSLLGLAGNKDVWKYISTGKFD